MAHIDDTRKNARNAKNETNRLTCSQIQLQWIYRLSTRQGQNSGEKNEYIPKKHGDR
jgi:hypothetical protein